MTLPIVAIVGRMNVGKSTLFNRLSSSAKSIAFDYEGVTRDAIYEPVYWKDRCFQLVDTGGIHYKKRSDPLQEQVRQKALEQIERASLVLFMCDGSIEPSAEDSECAKMLHKTGKSVLLVLNKGDKKDAAEYQYSFVNLGFSEPILISAAHGTGISALLERVTHLLPEGASGQQQNKGYNVVLLGKPNVGKSSLMNLLSKQERSLVSDMPGTTREAVSQNITFYREPITLTDTAGVRRKRSVGTETLEQMMVKNALDSTGNADVVLLLIDGSEEHLADQELKLAFYVFEKQYRPLIIIFNKHDVQQEYHEQMMAMSKDEYTFFLRKVPQLAISCKTGHHIGKVLPLVQKVWERSQQRFSSAELTTLFLEALTNRPLYHTGNRLLLRSVEHIAVHPMTIVLRVPRAHVAWYGESQKKFFENILRKKYDLVGVPIKFVIRAQ